MPSYIDELVRALKPVSGVVSPAALAALSADVQAALNGGRDTASDGHQPGRPGGTRYVVVWLAGSVRRLPCLWAVARERSVIATDVLIRSVVVVVAGAACCSPAPESMQCPDAHPVIGVMTARTAATEQVQPSLGRTAALTVPPPDWHVLNKLHFTLPVPQRREHHARVLAVDTSHVVVPQAGTPASVSADQAFETTTRATFTAT